MVWRIASESKVHVLDEFSEWFRSRVPFAEANGKVPLQYDAETLEKTLNVADETQCLETSGAK
jgi:hypothetical protein